MRNSKNISLPHPVLGIADDIKGSFEVILSCAIDDKSLILKSESIVINNNYFNTLLEEQKAKIIFKVVCNSTLFMKFIPNVLDLSLDRELFSKSLEIDILIVANEDINDYSDESFHEDTKLGLNRGIYKVASGSIIADAGTSSVNLDFEYRTGLSGIIEFEPGDPEYPISIDPDNQKIIIRYPNNPNNADMITMFTRGNKKYINVFMNLFIIPALTDSFNFLIQAKADNSYDEKISNLTWAKVIDENLEDEIASNDKGFELAQDFLEKMTEKKSGIAQQLPIYSAYNELFN
jgi:hypothetical protein